MVRAQGSAVQGGWGVRPHRDPSCAAASGHLSSSSLLTGSNEALAELLLGNEGASPLLKDTLLENTE